MPYKWSSPDYPGSAERLKMIIDMRKAGAYYKDIALEFDISRERVRQILKKAKLSEQINDNYTGKMIKYRWYPGYKNAST